MNQQNEQRKHVRYKAHNGVFVAVRPGYSEIGQVSDLSQGGLAFAYNPPFRQTDQWQLLDIFLLRALTGNAFTLEYLPFFPIYEQQMSSPEGTDALQAVRCGAKWGDLSQKQMDALDILIDNYCIPRA